MIAENLLSRRPSLRHVITLVVAVALALLPACKKKDPGAAGGDGAPTGDQPPAEQTPKEEPPVELKAKWPAGNRLVVQVVTQSETEIANPGQPQPIKSETSLTQQIAFTAGKEREAGGTEVDVEVVTVRADNKAAGKALPGFDPKGDPKNDRNYAMAAPFRKLIGSRVKYQTDASGNITKVDGVPQLASKVTSGTTGPAQFIARALVTEDAIKGWNVLHANLPTNSVKSGDTWETSKDLPYGIARFAITTTNTFKGWEQRDNKKMAKLEIAGVIGPKEGSQTAITIGEGATITGSSWYDPDLGVIAESDLTTQITVTIAQPSGQSTSSKVKTKSTTKLIETGDGGGNAAKVMEKPAVEPAPAPKPDAKKPKAK